MRNLVYLGLLSLAVVFVLAALPKFAMAGATPACDPPESVVCDDASTETTCLGSGSSTTGACVTVIYDITDAGVFEPSGSCTDFPNTVGIDIKATDTAAFDNPCASSSVNIPVGSCMDTDDDDDFRTCTAFFAGFDDVKPPKIGPGLEL